MGAVGNTAMGAAKMYVGIGIAAAAVGLSAWSVQHYIAATAGDGVGASIGNVSTFSDHLTANMHDPGATPTPSADPKTEKKS